jgi:hypothetical protein
VLDCIDLGIIHAGRWVKLEPWIVRHHSNGLLGNSLLWFHDWLVRVYNTVEFIFDALFQRGLAPIRQYRPWIYLEQFCETRNWKYVQANGVAFKWTNNDKAPNSCVGFFSILCLSHTRTSDLSSTTAFGLRPENFEHLQFFSFIQFSIVC